MKTMALVCAAMVSFSASAVGMQMAGWFHKPANRPQVHLTESQQSELVTRYRHSIATPVHLIPIYR